MNLSLSYLGDHTIRDRFMSKSLVQLILLAAVADGEIQDEEKLLLETYKARYPRLRRVTQKDYDEAQIELFNKVKAGVRIPHLIEDLGNNFSDAEKEIAFALTYEICASNFHLAPQEEEILNTIKKVWKLKASVVNAVKLSAQLRYDLLS